MILAATNFGFGELPTFDILPFLNVLPSAGGDDPWKLFNAALGGTPGARNSIIAILQTLNPANPLVEGYLRQIVALTGCSSQPWLQELQIPALVIAGDDDPYVSRSASRRLAQFIPNAKLKFVAGGGHLLPMNQPAQMVRIVDGFLSWVDRHGNPARLKYELGSYAVE